MNDNISNKKVAAVFQAYPENIKLKLLTLRKLILNTAAKTTGVGEIEETLKWGEPSYLTPETKSGSTIRIHSKAKSKRYGIYFNCQTKLVEQFRQRYGDEFTFEGNRCISFDENDDIPLEALSHCISMALTYHLDKK